MDEILKEAGEGVGELMKDFTVEYIKALINSKLEGAMDEAVETVFPSELAGGEEEDGGDDVVEEKGADEKEQGTPLAAGVQLRGYRLATGPDYAAHRFYEFACFAIKPQDSVITKVVKKHSQVTAWQKSFTKQCGDIPKEAAWPKKKMMGKNAEYYRGRYNDMDKYFQAITDVNAVSTHAEFLTYWNLQFDPDRADLLDIFMVGIEGLCEAKSVNFERAQRNAERLGFDLDECEMLKVVAVESVGRDCIRKLRAELGGKVGNMPAAVRNKFISKAEGKLAGVIGTAVETGWNAAKEAFTEIVKKINEVLEKGMEPIKELLNKALEPIGNIVKEKFAKANEKLEVDDKLDRNLNIARFPPLKSCLDSVGNGGKAYDEIEKLIENINKMDDCYQFSGYLMYNLGDPEIGQYIPFLNEIQDNHYRLAVAMTDLCYLLARATARAFKPLCNYLDVTSESFDAKDFDAGLGKALRESGRILASDYFDVPSQVRRMTWRLPNSVTRRLLAVGQTTICQVADLLGTLGSNWKPTSKDDAKSTFVKTIAEPLDAFIANRTQLFVTVVRRGTEAVIANQFMGTVEKMINEVAEPLNEACSALPDPLGENLKAGDIVAYLLNKMCENAIIKVVAMVAGKTEAILYDPEKFAEASEKDLVHRVRYRPYIRPDNYDPADPAEDSDGGDEEKNDKGGDEDGAAPEVKKQMTNDNTPDSDEEDNGAADAKDADAKTAA